MPVPVTGAASPRRLIRDEVFVSRTPVREALNQLATMGLVEILPQRRTRVTPIEPERLRDLVATVGVLVAGVVRDATPLLTDADRDQLRTGADGDAAALVRTGRSADGFLGVFVRRLDNGTVARLLKRHLPEVQRALNAAPTGAAFEKARSSVTVLTDAAAAGKADKAGRAATELFDTALTALADEFAASQKENR